MVKQKKTVDVIGFHEMDLLGHLHNCEGSRPSKFAPQRLIDYFFKLDRRELDELINNVSTEATQLSPL